MERAALATRASYFAGLPKPISYSAGNHDLSPNISYFSQISHVGFPLKGSKGGLCKLVEETSVTHQRRTSYLACSALAERPLGIPDCLDADDLPLCKLQALVSEFESMIEPLDRVKRLLHYASFLLPLPDANRIPSNRVMGCTAQVWLSARMDGGGRMKFLADSDSEITKGFCACLIHILNDAFPEEVLRLRTEDLGSLNIGLPGGTNSRINTWHNVLISMQKKTKAILIAKEGRGPVETFPTLVVNSDGIHAKGSYAEAQVSF